MKTLLLTSAGTNVKEEILKILPKPANQVKLAYVITASKVEEDKSYVEWDKKELIGIGFQVQDIDIEGKNEAELRIILREKDIIYVQGGNTFYLLKWVRESGFDKVAKELIEKGVIYIGVSAGTIISGPNIDTAWWKYGDPADRNEVGLKDFTGLNLVPFLTAVHIKESDIGVIRKYAAKGSFKVMALTDDQAILVQDDKYKLVGKGEEINI
jgi:dipeptidase E